MKCTAPWNLAMAGIAFAAAPAFAANMTVRLTLPSIDGGGGRRPYVAIWAERLNGDFASNLEVWYQIEDHHGRRGQPGPDGAAAPHEEHHWFGGGGHDGDLAPMQSQNTPGGARWLNGVRDWWAQSGHTLKFPVDGLTGPSRPAGAYELTYASTDPRLASLPPGQYRLVVEVAREHGGDETVSLPFSWPFSAPQSMQASGKRELGQVQLAVTP